MFMVTCTTYINFDTFYMYFSFVAKKKDIFMAWFTVRTLDCEQLVMIHVEWGCYLESIQCLDTVKMLILDIIRSVFILYM